MKTRFEKSDIIGNSDESRAISAASRVMPSTHFKSVTKIPGAYNIWAIGTTGDVTILVWLHIDGHVTTDVVCW
jgi:hypothetical protein